MHQTYSIGSETYSIGSDQMEGLTIEEREEPLDGWAYGAYRLPEYLLEELNALNKQFASRQQRVI